MYKNPFEQLDDCKTIALAFAAQLRAAGSAQRIMAKPDQMAGFLEIMANAIEEVLEEADSTFNTALNSQNHGQAAKTEFQPPLF